MLKLPTKVGSILLWISLIASPNTKFCQTANVVQLDTQELRT